MLATKEFEITQEIIDKSHPKWPTDCVITNAIKAKIPGWTVSVNGFSVKFIKNWDSAPIEIRLPRDVQLIAFAFDDGVKKLPLTFSLTADWSFLE